MAGEIRAFPINFNNYTYGEPAVRVVVRECTPCAFLTPQTARPRLVSCLSSVCVWACCCCVSALTPVTRDLGRG